MPEGTTINYAEKYSAVIDERFKVASITDAAVNKNYDFDGVKKISVYSVDTAELVDYDRTSSGNRYGVPKELGNSVQTMELKQDKSFTFTIDRGNHSDTVLANSAGNALKREVDEVVTPTVDKYRLGKMAAGAGTILNQEISPDNAYAEFLDATAVLTENKVPMSGRIAYVTPGYYKQLKLDTHFTGKGDKANEIAANGSIGQIDGIQLILTPSEYLPAGTNFMVTHPSATLGPVKIAEYKTHENPQGISGWLCEGRVYYDAFVLKNKKKAILISHRGAALKQLTIGNLTLSPIFSGATKSYTTSTSNASNTISAEAVDNSATIEIKNGDTVIQNGTAASWQSGENTVTVTVTNGIATEIYTVTVTKS